MTNRFDAKLTKYHEEKRLRQECKRLQISIAAYKLLQTNPNPNKLLSKLKPALPKTKRKPAYFKGIPTQVPCKLKEPQVDYLLNILQAKITTLYDQRDSRGTERRMVANLMVKFRFSKRKFKLR